MVASSKQRQRREDEETEMITTLTPTSLEQGRIASAKRAARFHGEAEWEAQYAAKIAARERMSFLERFSRAVAGPAAVFLQH
jgi:hypothetical protein